MEFLEDVGIGGEAFDGTADGIGPGVAWEVVADRDAPGAPGVFGEAGDFENKLAVGFAEIGELVPIVDPEFGVFGEVGERGGIDDPAERDVLTEEFKVFTEGVLPVVAECGRPE